MLTARVVGSPDLATPATNPDRGDWEFGGGRLLSSSGCSHVLSSCRRGLARPRGPRQPSCHSVQGKDCLKTILCCVPGGWEGSWAVPGQRPICWRSREGSPTPAKPCLCQPVHRSTQHPQHHWVRPLPCFGGRTPAATQGKRRQ